MSRENEQPTPIDDMSRDELVVYARETQKSLGAETTRANNAEKRAALSDTTNRGRGRPKKVPRKCARYTVLDSDDENGGDGDGDGDGDDGEGEADDGDDDGEKARLAGHKYVLVKGLWFCRKYDKVLGAKKKDYDEENRFDTNQDKVQGELRDALDVFPDELEDSVAKGWLMFRARAFNAGMERQRSNTSGRLRDCGAMFKAHCPDIIKQDTDIEDEAARRQYIAPIGGRENAEKKMVYYLFDAPVLHSDRSNRLNVETFLHSKLIMHVAVAVVFGKKRAIKLGPLDRSNGA
ncbi:hypothetical protein R3P38DRAFT_2775840 [Favolaschia claudopus]|uniref:Uncharacterized protein n=1 Tax=Favolaschia claudopus TaxID=2862362 RepID=A0AAW0BRH5_9AGAR